MTSIIEESKQARSNGIFGFWRNKKFIYGVIIFTVVFGSYFYFFNSSEKETVKTPSVKEEIVHQGNIIVSVESDGKVVAKDGVELSFAVFGNNLEVDEIFVKEGDKIAKGDKIASVKTEALDFNLRTAWSSYQSALADYNEVMDGATDEDLADAKDRITSAEISLEQAKISLANTKQSATDSIYNAEQALKDAKENLENNRDELSSEDVEEAYKDLIDIIKSISISLENILPESDEIIGVDNTSINDAFDANLGVENLTSLSSAIQSYNQAKNEKEILGNDVLLLNYSSSYSNIDSSAQKAEVALEIFEDHLYDMQTVLDATITSNNLSQSALDSFKATINSNRASINTKITMLNTGIKGVEDARDSLDDYVDDYEEKLRDLENAKADAERDIKNSEANIASKELLLEQTKRDYNELTAPLTDAELASARSRLTSAFVSLEKAQYELDKSILTSPIDGELVQLNYAVGDIIITDDNEPVAVIINNDTLFIEVNIEEADISKLAVGQKAYATFDALDELTLEGEISFISLTSKISNNGIVTYMVRVIFNKGEHQIREGMTAYIDFVISEARDILIIPVDAVRNVGGKPSVQLISGEWTEVATGFTDGKKVEVISGLNAGDKILY